MTTEQIEKLRVNGYMKTREILKAHGREGSEYVVRSKETGNTFEIRLQFIVHPQLLIDLIEMAKEHQLDFVLIPGSASTMFFF